MKIMGEYILAAQCGKVILAQLRAVYVRFHPF